MTELEKQEYLAFAKDIAYAAGEMMLKWYDRDIQSHYKSDETIVTIADEEINQFVIDSVKKHYPSHDIDGEEKSQKTGASYVWVCDPIDGTNPFAMGLPVSVFSLALVVDGVPQVGVIYDPHGDKLYSATKGGGAFINDEKLCVSQEDLSRKARVNLDWWADAEYDVAPIIYQLTHEKGAYILCPGSATHAAARVAKGDFVASVFPGTEGKHVDIAAAKVVVEEAGGKVTDLFGHEQRYDRAIKGAIVSNGVVHDVLVEYLSVLEDK